MTCPSRSSGDVGGSVAPTEAGAALLATLAPALDNIGGALDALERGRGRVAGTLRFTCTRQAFEAVLRPVLSMFASTHPNASVEVMVDTAYRDLVADRLDAGIRLGEKLEQDMIALKVGPELCMAVVASPAHLATAESIAHPRDLLRHRCIGYRMLSSGALCAWEFERAGEVLSVQVSGPSATNEPDLMLAAALDGLGICDVLENEAARMSPPGGWCGCWKTGCPLSGLPPLLPLAPADAAGVVGVHRRGAARARADRLLERF